MLGKRLMMMLLSKRRLLTRHVHAVNLPRWFPVVKMCVCSVYALSEGGGSMLSNEESSSSSQRSLSRRSTPKSSFGFTHFHTTDTPTDPMNAATASSLVDGGGALNMRKLQQELVSAFVVSFPFFS